MKKILLCLFVSGAFSCAFAQLPTFDFESWTGTGPGIEPTGWVSGNAITSFPFSNPQSVFQESTAANVHSGTYSMKLVTVTLSNNPDPTTIPNPMGAAFPGIVSISPLGLVDGFAYASRPADCQFWYKYSPVGADSASAYIVLTKWNSPKRDTIAAGGWVLKTAATTYTQATLNLIYDPAFNSMVSDTIHLYFTATCYSTLTCGTAGSTLWVDDISLNGWNGINEYPGSEGVSVYPNPANEFVTISLDAADAVSLNAYDATGRIISSVPFYQATNGMNKKTGTITTSALAAGIYSYSILDKNGSFLRSGKFSVVR